jgi:hypothetical protein
VFLEQLVPVVLAVHGCVEVVGAVFEVESTETVSRDAL